MSDTNMGYVSLHNHTTFSILDSLVKPIDLFKRAKELGQEAIAVTDHGTMAGMWDSLLAAKQVGIKLIPGCEFYFVDDLNNKESKLRHIILLAKNQIGYKNLLLAAAEGYDNFIVAFKKAIPRISWDVLEKYSEGLICTTACANGILGQLINKKKIEEAEAQAKKLQDIFGDNLAIELQAHGLKRINSAYSGEVDQQYTNIKLKEIAEKLNIRTIVSSDTHYLAQEQAKAHDVLLAIAAGHPIESGSRLKYDVPDLYLKSGDEVFKKLKRLMHDEEFAKKCIENTKYFADQCEFPNWIDPKHTNPSGKELPEFPVKDQKDYNEFLLWKETCNLNKDEDELYLRFRVELGLNKKILKENQQIYIDNLRNEFDVIEYHKFSSYMLIVMDFVEWAKDHNIPVGPARGSCAGSCIGYFAGIHEVDPLKYKLIFARFHNKQKKSFPDIDTDIGTAGRDLVQDYVVSKYGRDHVAHVSNVNTMTPKVYARAIARTYSYGGDRKTAVKVGTAIADSIPNEIKKIDEALEKAALFAEYAKYYPELSEFAKDIGGKTVAWATHAAGVIIGKRPLRGLVPIRKDKDGNVSIEYEKERAEANGLVKMDFLGLSTLDIIEETYKLIELNGKGIVVKPDLEKYDEKAYDLIGRGDTFGVFQFGTSGGTIDLCKRIKPKNIEDLATITTLARPSAKAIRDLYIKTRNGELPMNLIHEKMKSAFDDTFGFSLYEESLLSMCKELCGWDHDKSDAMRKMTKNKGKHPELVKQLQTDFINDAEKNGVERSKAEEIWTKIVLPFGEYGFNKSHAVSYSLVSYHTAWLKAHYPLEFLVANLKAESQSGQKIAKDNIAKIKEEIRAMGVKIIPPDINESEMTYKIIDDNTLMTGLDALKFMGKDAIPEILEKRPFSSFEDFLSKVDGKKVKAPAIQALAASGCLDSFGIPRRFMYLYAADFKKKITEYIKKNKTTNGFKYPWPDEEDWTYSEKSALERFYIGESLSSDKFKEYSGFFNHNAINFKNFKRLLPQPPSDLTEKERRAYSKSVNLIQGEVKSLFEFKVKKEDSKIKGEIMARITIEDPYGNQVGVTCFPDGWAHLQSKCLNYSNNKQKLEPGCGMYLSGSLNWYDNEISIIFSDLDRFCGPPELPSDFKEKRKVSMRISSKKEETDKNVPEEDRNILLDELEAELIEIGNSDLDDEYMEEIKEFG